MGAEEAKRRIIAAVMARHRARIALETSIGPGNVKQRARRKAYRVIDAAERALEVAATELDRLCAEHGSTINGLENMDVVQNAVRVCRVATGESV